MEKAFYIIFLIKLKQLETGLMVKWYQKMKNKYEYECL